MIWCRKIFLKITETCHLLNISVPCVRGGVGVDVAVGIGLPLSVVILTSVMNKKH